MAIKSLLYSAHKYSLALLVILLCSLMISCSNKQPETDLAQSPEKDIQGEGSTIPDWSELKIEPATGHIGDKVTILGNGLNAEVDLILFGQKIIHPIQQDAHKGDRLFLETQGHDSKTSSPSLSFFVPNLCARKYNVAMVRQLSNQEPKKSPDLIFEVLGEPCATSNKETDNKTPSASETILETTKGVDKTTAQSVPFVVALEANPGYFEDPTALKHQVKVKWQILSGTIDSVTLYNQDQPEQKKDFNDQSLMAKQGEWVFEIDKTATFIGKFTSGDQVYTETTRVVVFGNENVDSLAPFVKTSLKEKTIYAKASNQFNPSLEFCWVSNKVDKVQFKVPQKTWFNLGPKHSWYIPPKSKTLKGCHTFHPKVDLKSEDTYILPEAIINNDTESETIPFETIYFKVETDASSAQMSTREDKSPDHLGYNIIEIHPKNLKLGGLISEQPLLDTNYKELPYNLPFEDENGMKKYLYIIPENDLMTAVKLNYRSQANCKSLCKYNFSSKGWDGRDHELNQVADSQAPEFMLTQFKLSPSNWTKTHIRYEARNVSHIKFYYCQPMNPIHEESGPQITGGDLVLDTCSQLIKNNYLIVQYRDHYGQFYRKDFTPTNIPELPEDEGEAKLAALGMGYELNVDTLRAENNIPSEYVVMWKTDWVKSVEILVYSQEDLNNPNTDLATYERAHKIYSIDPSDMNYVVDADNLSISSGQMILPAHEDYYLFVLRVKNIDGWAASTAPIKGMPPVKIKYEYIDGNTNHKYYRKKVDETCILWSCSSFYEKRCSAPDYRRHMVVEIKNGIEVDTPHPVRSNVKTVWTESYTKDGLSFICPGSSNSADIYWENTDLFRPEYLGQKWLSNTKEFSSNRIQSWDMMYHYYYDPDILYGCRVCTLGKEDGQTYCVENQLWDNEPAATYEAACSRRVQHESPVYCDENDPWKTCEQQEIFEPLPHFFSTNLK